MADITQLALRTATAVQALAAIVRPLAEAHPIRPDIGPIKEACDELDAIMDEIRNAPAPVEQPALATATAPASAPVAEASPAPQAGAAAVSTPVAGDATAAPAPAST